jgi:hypothetical protein
MSKILEFLKFLDKIQEPPVLKMIYRNDRNDEVQIAEPLLTYIKMLLPDLKYRDGDKLTISEWEDLKTKIDLSGKVRPIELICIDLKDVKIENS